VFGAGAQVGAQLIAFASRFGPHLVQHLAGVGADPLGFGLGSAGGGLGAGGLLLSPPGGGLGGGRVSEGVDPVPQPGTQRGDPVGLGAQRPQQIGPGHPGGGKRAAVLGRADFRPGLLGGRTCLCNADPKCRHDHRLKQHPRWNADRLPDGHIRWTAPSGRTYTTEPTRYPI
jgi:hypothetical protein